MDRHLFLNIILNNFTACIELDGKFGVIDPGMRGKLECVNSQLSEDAAVRCAVTWYN